MAGYGDDTLFAAFLASNGYTLPVGAPAPAVLRQRGSAYIDATYGPRFPGYPTAGIAQEGAWPRTGATAFGAAIDSALIPVAVLTASYHAALYEAQNPGGLAVAVIALAQVKREKVDVIETEYFAAADPVSGATPLLSAVEGLLAPLFARPEIGAIYVV